MAAAISSEALRYDQYFCTGWLHGKGRLVNKVRVRKLKNHHHASEAGEERVPKALATACLKRLPDFLGKC